MFLFFTKDRLIKQSDELHPAINTKVGVGVQFADALLANKNDDAMIYARFENSHKSSAH